MVTADFRLVDAGNRLFDVDCRLVTANFRLVVSICRLIISQFYTQIDEKKRDWGRQAAILILA